ncbi:MAG TPA: hypothetical protein V6C89_20650 [Drouetiella sp.]|jgi:hypothetical protein
MGFLIAVLLSLLAVSIVVILMNTVDRSSMHVEEQLDNPDTPITKTSDTVIAPAKALICETSDTTFAHPDCSINGQTVHSGDLMRVRPMRKIQQLSLKACNSQDDVFLNCSSLPLQTIRFRQMEISKESLRSVGLLKHLRHVTFVDCTLASGALEGLATSPAFWVEIRDCQKSNHLSLSAADVRALSHMANLVRLEISGTSVESGDFGLLQNSLIEMMDCRRCRLTDDDLTSLAKCESLHYLNIENNPSVSAAAVAKLASLPNLRQIRFDRQTSFDSFNLSQQSAIKLKNYRVPEKLQREFAQ